MSLISLQPYEEGSAVFIGFGLGLLFGMIVGNLAIGLCLGVGLGAVVDGLLRIRAANRLLSRLHQTGAR